MEKSEKVGDIGMLASLLLLFTSFFAGSLATFVAGTRWLGMLPGEALTLESFTLIIAIWGAFAATIYLVSRKIVIKYKYRD